MLGEDLLDRLELGVVEVEDVDSPGAADLEELQAELTGDLALGGEV